MSYCRYSRNRVRCATVVSATARLFAVAGRALLGFAALSLAASCTYLKYASVQSDYARLQKASPGQVNVKHMLDRETYFVHGRCNDDGDLYRDVPKAIAAYSSKFRPNERVATMQFQVAGSHYGLNLPEGRFELFVFADIDRDGAFEASEAVGQRSIVLDTTSVPGLVTGQVDIRLGRPFALPWNAGFAASAETNRPDSLFFPAGTIRGLDDPIFDTGFSTIGMYDPASFLEEAPMMFYALEEDVVYKIPVVFVHGIGGSARQFLPLVEDLDRTRYKPWFFHYPSGGDLDQLAELFYQIFLSGKVYEANGMPIIVIAHSMGGLVVREAINRYRDQANENQLKLLVTLATPFGGHAAAATGEKRGLIVLPSWRDLNPDNAFIRDLYRHPLPGFVQHELYYAYHNDSGIKFGDNSDGVVALTSQLHPPAQQQASARFGFDSTHAGILENPDAFARIRERMADVDNVFPPAHLRALRRGGFDVPLGADYPAMAAFMIRNYGIYLMALTDGTLAPESPNERHFVAVANRLEPPRNADERSWLRFLSEHEHLRRGRPTGN